MYKLVSHSWSVREGKGGGRPAAAKAPTTHIPGEPLHSGPGPVSDNRTRTSSYNDHAPPANASKSGQEYATRPLPVPPTSKIKMANRPSTSGGPGSRKPAKNDFKFDQRLSRDDLYIGSRAYEGSRPGPFNRFQGQPPTPDSSPKTAPVQRFVAGTTAWEPAICYLAESGHGVIGMALGSPTHPPIVSGTWNSQEPIRPEKVSSPLVTTPDSRGSSVDAFDMPISRKPTGKWKLFSRFGRKQSDQSVPAVTISDPNNLKSFHRAEEEVVVASQRVQLDPKSPARSNTLSSRKAPKHKPIVIRSQTMPSMVQPDIHDPQRKRGGTRGDGELGRIPLALTSGSSSSPVTGSLLNVEIPDVRMERYSVMFNSVLNSNPSLLTRRQANVQKLKSVEDAVEREEQEKLRGATRRATSPQPATRSSGLGLFPSSRQGHHLAPQKLSPRLRSNTSPALLPSPSKAAFDHTKPNHKSPSIQETASSRFTRHHSHHHPDKPTITIATTDQESVPVPLQFSNDESNLVLDSPTEIEPTSAEYDTIKKQTWKPSTHHLSPEPKWQIISPSTQKTPSTESSSSYTGSGSSYRKRSPSLASSSHTRQSEDADDLKVTNTNNSNKNGKMMTPVEISIARQISMSRQQRKLLQPLRTGTGTVSSTSTSISTSTSPSPRRPSTSATTSNHHASSLAQTSPMAVTNVVVAVGETKTSTPTLVHPPDMMLLGSNLAGVAQYRRSERIVLEGS